MNIQILAALALAATVVAAPAAARDYTAGGLTIGQPWSRTTPPGAPTAAGFLTLLNRGPDDRLIGGRTPVAAEVQIHEMTTAGGVMRMRPLAQGLALPRGGSATLAPGGLHIMLIGLKRPLAAGERVPLTLRFQKAGEVAVELEVRALGQGAAR
jgi:copper(I)-binding protein